MIGAPPADRLGATILVNGLVTGVVMIQTYSPDSPLGREDEHALASLCPHIGTAIAHTELRHHARRRASR